MLKTFQYLFIFPIILSFIQANENNTDTPPPFWCEDDSLAKEVGVYDGCKTYNDTVSGKRIKLTLLYETLCPDCQRFMKDVLYAQVWKRGKDLVRLELIPYGNARHTSSINGTYDITCQHGPLECKLNRLHSCVIHQLTDTNRWFPFIYCMEIAISEGRDPDEATKTCYKEQGVKQNEQQRIDECTKGAQGDQLQKQAADRTDNVKPDSHMFVPWILVNDVSLMKAQMYQSVLFLALCDWYRAEEMPANCRMFMKEMIAKEKCLK